MGKCLHFKCPVVMRWWFSSFQKAFQKVEKKKWSFSWPRPCRKSVNFANFKFVHISYPNGQILHFKCPVVNWWWFSSFWKIFQKAEKIEDFHDRGPIEKVNFANFTFLHIRHPNGQIFTFKVSCGQLVVVFIILEGFPESRKNWRFSWLRICRKIAFLLNSNFCIFLIQMGKYLHFKCPLVMVFLILGGFPESRKKKKVFHDRGSVEKVWFLLISHFCIFLTQMGKYSHLKCPVEDFHDRGPVKKKAFFANFTFLHISHPNW